MFLLSLGEMRVVGASPEVLVRVEDGEVLLRPIAGTRPRGSTGEEDDTLAAELLADEKELAEHRMLVDLARNDAGRIAAVGSVRVERPLHIERYSHVMHIVSDVRATTREGCDAFDVFRACFPAGTVSGAPKVRAMEFIAEREGERRGVYAGAVGYFDFGGNMDTCIAIRTMVLYPGRVFIQAGAGIVFDSVGEAEAMECRNKARGALAALHLAGEVRE
jgi:anthranilate synthase component 1